MLLSPQLYRPAPKRVAGLGLKTNLISCWELESTSWLDSHGSNTLTGVSSPTVSNASTPLIGNYGSFVAASTQYLTIADNASLSLATNNAFSVAAWAWMTSVSDGQVICSKGGNAGASNAVWRLYYDFTAPASGHKFAFEVYNAGGPTSATAVTAAGVATTGAWHLLVGTYNPVATEIKLYHNNDAAITTSTAGFSMVDDTGPFNIANSNNGGAYWNGRGDQVCFWKDRVLTAGDVTAFYNGGAGLSYAAMA